MCCQVMFASFLGGETSMQTSTTETTATRTETSSAVSTHSQFGKITKSIVRAKKEMGWQAYHIYTALLTYRSDATGLAWVAIDTLASDTGIDRRHVQRGIAKLITLGAVTLIGTHGPKGINVWSVELEMPNDRKLKNSIINDAFVEPMASSAMARGAAHSEVSFFREKKLQPPNPHDVASKSDNVVVLLPTAPKAKATEVITQEAPQAEPPTEQPISQPTPLTANSEQHGPTVGIVNGITVQAKPISPNKVEPIKTPAPKTEPAHPPAFHHSLTRSEAATIMVLMAVLPQDVQAIVMDELIAQLDGGNVRRPVGYAKRLIEVAQAGAFVPSAAREAAQRAETDAQETEQKRKQAEEERAEEEAETKAKILLDEAKQKAGNDRLAELRADFILRLKEAGSFTYQRLKSERFQGIGFGLLFDEYLKKVLLNSEPPQG